ncbi:MAG TPA: tetratricopeptide repeat protein [Planctomycetes bacterium]|nr:tetratricopeptide repeat protein [Planctomycetota bacterium]
MENEPRTPRHHPFRILLLAPLLAACGANEGPVRSVLLVTLDTTNPSTLSCYGAPDGLTPHFDRLAEEGVLYSNARTPVPITAPSHSSMMTGLYPLRHSVRMNGSMVLPESAITLAERARARGIETAAFIAAVVLEDEFGLSQGFQTYDQPEGGATADPEAAVSRSCVTVTDRVLDWFEERDPSLPFFLWIHYFDAHGPHKCPEEFLGAAGGDPYLGEVGWIDREFGRVLAHMEEDGLLDETLVVVTADHGEGRGRHGENTHGCFGFDSTLRVPLILRYPDGWSAGARFADRVSLVDLYPTISTALNLGVPETHDGVDLFRRRVPEDRGVYFETYFGYISFGWSPLCGWVDSRGKYVHASTQEFYFPADRGEETNVIDEVETRDQEGAIAELSRRSRLEQPGLGGEDRSLQAQIEKLGYAGAGTEFFRLPDPLDSSDRASPHTRAASLAGFLKAQSFVRRGQVNEAIRTLREVMEGDPSNHTAQHLLAQCLMQAGRFHAAIDANRRAIELREGEWVAPYLDMALCYEQLGRPEDAIASYERAFAFGAGPAAAKERWISLLESVGRSAEAASLRSK